MPRAKNKIHNKNNYLFPNSFYLGMLLLVFFVFNCGIKANAQSALDIVLNSSADALPIGPYTYITNRQPGSDLTEADVAKQHLELMRGKLYGLNTINVGTKYRQTWLTFSIYNRTNIKDWVIDFGNISDGRLALVRSIVVYNDETKQSTDYPDGKQGKYFGSAIPIELKPKSQNVIVLKFDAERGFPLTISPTIRSQDGYINSLMHFNFYDGLIYSFYVLMILACIGFWVVSQKKYYAKFLFYYLGMAGVYLILNNTFYTPFVITGETTFLLYMCASISLILGIKSLLGIDRDDTPLENAALYAGITFLILCGLLHLSFFNQTDTGFWLYSSVHGALYTVMIFITALAGHKKEISVKYLCLGLSFSVLSNCIMILNSMGIIPPNVIILGLFWILFIPQGALFAYANYELIKIDIENKEREKLRRMHDTHSISRIQKTKENTDQTRLLRIIERERQLMNELREKEAIRAEEMRLAKDMADRANQSKSAFLAVVSHEIRTPMTGIMGMADLLQGTNLNKVQSDYVDTIRKSGNTMMTLLNDILDFEKIEYGSMRIENTPLDVRQLAHDIVNLMTGQAAQQNIYLIANVDANVPRAVYGDPTRLRQILLNLVGNALKFTNQGGVTLQISLTNTNSDTPFLTFKVIDTGIGIPAHIIPTLFLPFAQAETSTARKYGGTGLGLAISSRLIDAMGGKIKVTSEENKGSTFYFSIPLNEYNGDLGTQHVTPSQPSVTKNITPSHPMHILVADDNEVNRKVLQGLLERDGHKVIFASSGHEALEMCRNHIPEIVLMDIQMPDLNGIDATKALRADLNDTVAAIPVIALTGNISAEDIATYFAANINGFVGKPIDQEFLRKTLYNASQNIFETPVIKKYETLKTQRTLKDINHDLEFENTEQFELLQNQQKQKQQEENTLLNIKLNLNFEDSDSPMDKGKANTNTQHKSKQEEITDIQKFLIQNYGDEAAKAHEQTQNASENQPIQPPKETEKQSAKKEDKKSPSVFGILKEQSKTQPKKTDDVKTEIKTPITPPALETTLIDVTTLQNLVSALGKNQFAQLLDGFLDKAQEIITEIENAITQNDMKEFAIRTHDLKGMAGNFGMTELSRIAAEAEKATKTGQNDLALREAKKLNDANIKSRSAVTHWLNEQS